VKELDYCHEGISARLWLRVTIEMGEKENHYPSDLGAPGRSEKLKTRYKTVIARSHDRIHQQLFEKTVVGMVRTKL
jgi:hypothetical protein